MIPYEDLHLVNTTFHIELKNKFSDFLDKGDYILGKEVEKFEHVFALYNKANYCIGVANGLDALMLSLKTCKFEKGSEVIVPSNTYIATILAVLQCDLMPVLVEPDLQTYNIDPNKIEEQVTSKTKAILIVHLYGKCCQIEPILTIKEKYHLYLIEDCAQAHGATYRNKKAGTFGEFGAFSFYPTKNLGAFGDAGAILCKDKNHKKILTQLRNYGSDKKYYNEELGLNSRLDELQASFLNVKLQSLDKINTHKRNLAQLYHKHLKDDFILPVQNLEGEDVYHIFNIRHPKRDHLKTYLKDNQIGTEIHYPIPPHQQKAMKGIFKNNSYPISEQIHQTTLSLPCSLCHSEDDILQVIETMNKF